MLLTKIYLYLLDFYFSTGKMAACKPNYYSPPPEFQTSRQSCVKLNFLDRPEIVELPLVDSCEELWRLGARKIVGVKPPALEIFGIKSTKSSIWLRYHSYNLRKHFQRTKPNLSSTFFTKTGFFFVKTKEFLFQHYILTRHAARVKNPGGRQYWVETMCPPWSRQG